MVNYFKLFIGIFIINTIDSLKIFYTSQGLNGGYRQYEHTKASFGADAYNITGELIVGEPLNGCNINKYYNKLNDSYNNVYLNNIVLVQRGECTFSEKTYNLQKLGAIGVIIGDYSSDNPDEWVIMNKNDNNIINIPSIFIQYKSYKKIINIYNDNKIYNDNIIYATLDTDGLFHYNPKSKWLTVLSFAIIIVPILWCCVVILKLSRKQCNKYKKKLQRIKHIKTIPIITYKINNNNDNSQSSSSSDNNNNSSIISTSNSTDNNNTSINNDDGGLTEALIIEVESNNILKKLQNKLKSITISKKNKEIITQTPLNDNCCICLDEFKHNDKVRLLHCMHGFHPKCVEPWFKKSEFCPMCKQSIFEPKKDANIIDDV